MLRRQRQIQIHLQQIVDGGLFALGLWLAHLLRDRATEFFPQLAQISDFSQYLWLFLLIIPATPLLLKAQGFYNRPLIYLRWETFWTLVEVASVLVLGVVTMLFITKDEMARSVVMLFAPIGVTMIYVKEELILRWLVSEAGQAQLKRRVILIGGPEETSKIENDFEEKMPGAVKVLEKLEPADATSEKLVQLLHDHSANGVILKTSHAMFGEVERIIEICELEGVEVWLLADFFQTQISQTTMDDFLGRPTLVFRSAPEASWQGLGKQILDVVGALNALLFLAVPMLFVALLIRLTSKGPVLFRQRRSGLNGQPFTMLKFRTMVTDAEQQKAELAAFNEMEGPTFKLTEDPRITPLGRILRKFSIDELPQLWNVVMGEMSLVGPRPLPVDEVKRINDRAHRRRLSVKPGLTCLWQISGRNRISTFGEWVRLDLEYIDNWSLWLDLKILFKTIPVVILGTGAK